MERRTVGMILFVLVILCVAFDQTEAESKKLSSSTLHREAIVVDGHVHITNSVFNQGIDPWKVQPTGTFDYARAKEGGLDVVIEQVYVDDRYNSYNYTVKQACRLIETFYRVLDANRDKMELALSSADVRRIVARGKMAVILALEGGFDTEGDLDVLRLFHRLGVRMVQLTNHDVSNVIADGYAGEQKWKGISDHGRTVIQEMNRLGIIIDMSHASAAAKLQSIQASRAPVVTSHNGLLHFANFVGNLSDETLKALAAKGGMIGLHSAGWIISQKGNDWARAHWYYPPSRSVTKSVTKSAIFRPPGVDYGDYIAKMDAEMRDLWNRWGYGRPWRENHQEAIEADAPLPTVEEWADQIDYVVKLVGADYVGMGLDLLAGGNWLRDFDATSYPRLTEALVAKGYTPTVIRKILGENWLRLLDAAKVP
jgi:membrane dipeptidase